MTAKEFIGQSNLGLYSFIHPNYYSYIEEVMIEFAKIKVKESIEIIINNTDFISVTEDEANKILDEEYRYNYQDEDGDYQILDIDKMRNSYKLDDIK